MENKPLSKGKIVTRIIGIALLLIQLIACCGTYLEHGNIVTAHADPLYNIIYFVSYFFFGIIGAVLLLTSLKHAKEN